MIVPLSQLADAGSDKVGGKAWNLGRLAQAGERVPLCFAITVDESQGFAEFAGINDLMSVAQEPLELSKRVLQNYEEAYPRYVRLAEVVEAGFKMAPELSNTRLAIRSSASFEDVKEVSSAGQHDTFLGISGVDPTVRAVAMCWASQWTERAISYRRSRGIEAAAANMGVVVQQFLPSDKSGVMFTQDPTRPKKGLLIEATRGLGEALVSGRVIPERVRLDGAGLIEERVVAPGKGELLSDAETEALARAGMRIEAAFGEPQDIEWAFIGARLYILQTRPIASRIANRDHKGSHSRSSP